MKSLTLVQEIFSDLDRQGLRYCHWKSNDHLEEALLGLTDLDLLVHPDDREAFRATLSRYDAKPMIGQPESTYPGLEDWLGFDRATGELIHLHVHYRVILGRQRIKEYHPPVAERLLHETRRIGVMQVPRAEAELALLVVRANVKLKWKTLLQGWRREGLELYPKEIRREFDWLQSDADDDTALAEIEAMELPLDRAKVLDFLAAVRDRSLTAAQVRDMRTHLFARLARYRWQSRWGGSRRWLQSRFFSHKLIRKRLLPRKKRLHERGMILTLAGADGAGKTTLAADLERWLVWKLRAVQCYMGIPKSSALLYALARVRKLGRRLRFAPLERGAGSFYWLWTARCRRVAASRAQRLAERGYLVLTDRYPLAEFRAMREPMDGPRISAQYGPRQRALARREQEIYQGIERPDCIFVLQTKLDVLRGRKQDLAIETHRMKADAVNSLTEGEGRVLIDGNRPYDAVLLDLKQRIWKLL